MQRKITTFLKISTFIFIGLCFINHVAFSQCNVTTASDQDGDGVSDLSGQDKCPSTLSQIEGQRATVINEYSGQEVVVRFPKKLKNFICQDRVPLDEAKIKLLNEQAKVKRERKRVEEKYGKYADMKGNERKTKEEEFAVEIDKFQVQIDSIQDLLRNVNPNSYIEFVGNLLDSKGSLLQENVKFKIRIEVDQFGCLPDNDRDGSPNIVDLCPDEVGTIEGAGCPDRDKDGVPDKEDRCPDVPGSVESFGCPDRDGDGVPDPEDACPDTPGVIKLAGCPDRDKDGIPDKDDECPDVPGSVETKGCPDRDKDGIADKNDDCPDNPGPVETKGCPDRDKDGVLDKDDECPDVPGPVENKGCPKILEKASRVLFETGKSVIKTVSYPLLDELVELLKEYPDADITLAGHTDSEGEEADNLQLSTDRAAAVKTYLIEKGIAEDRISSTGFGESKPIANNGTADGRAKNRRVEMKLSNKQK
jgi:outer membrane protein OmpA-like peptidoglycan-associated protein